MARICRDDLPDGHSEIFLQEGLDTPVNKPPDGQITAAYFAVSAACFRIDQSRETHHMNCNGWVSRNSSSGAHSRRPIGAAHPPAH
jgi:hypothetical protein